MTTSPTTAPTPDRQNLDDRHPIPRGVMVTVYRPAAGGDCTNGGVTGQHDHVVLTGRGIPELMPAVDMPALVIVERTIGGRRADYAVPVDLPERTRNMVGPMFGGNFVYSSDSRFTERPIPVHDRYETWTDYDVLSR